MRGYELAPDQGLIKAGSSRAHCQRQMDVEWAAHAAVPRGRSGAGGREIREEGGGGERLLKNTVVTNLGTFRCRREESPRVSGVAALEARPDGKKKREETKNKREREREREKASASVMPGMGGEEEAQGEILSAADKANRHLPFPRGDTLVPAPPPRLSRGRPRAPLSGRNAAEECGPGGGADPGEGRAAVSALLISSAF
jgi:hypothetical protein